ncbi:MAG: hypothetical protein ABEJ93_04240 [Candidatus Nanohalobium sp.]
MPETKNMGHGPNGFIIKEYREDTNIYRDRGLPEFSEDILQGDTEEDGLIPEDPALEKWAEICLEEEAWVGLSEEDLRESDSEVFLRSPEYTRKVDLPGETIYLPRENLRKAFKTYYKDKQSKNQWIEA